MKFGPVPVAKAEGAICAHSVRHPEGTIKKGQILLKDDIEALVRGGFEEIIVARLEKGDVGEDKAAAMLAAALAGDGVRVDKAFTGRANLFAAHDGLFVTDSAALARLNRIDDAITVATLDPYDRVAEGRMVATVKIIPYAVRERALKRALDAAKKAGPLACVAGLKARRVGLVATRVEGTREKVLDKTARILAERLEALGARLGEEIRCEHDSEDVAAAVAKLRKGRHDLIIVFGASAIIDRRDMVPTGIKAAGGTLTSFGMPVDPGNLLLLADLDGVPVIGAPGCARSPRENGFDWVLERLLAGIPVTRADITALGAGGLLMEIESRPQPRLRAAEPAKAPRVAAIVLAAGRSRRMGGANKLLEDFAGKPMVRHAAEAALATGAGPVIAVTGHMREAVAAALDGLGVRIVHNPDYGEGLSSSMQAGLAVVPETCDGVLVCLGDMPAVGAGLMQKVIAAFAPDSGRLIVVPTHQGKRGNPVLFSTRFRDALMDVRGDVGARHLIGANEEAVFEVETDAACLMDLDTPEALAQARTALAGNDNEEVVE